MMIEPSQFCSFDIDFIDLDLHSRSGVGESKYVQSVVILSYLSIWMTFSLLPLHTGPVSKEMSVP